MIHLRIAWFSRPPLTRLTAVLVCMASTATGIAQESSLPRVDPPPPILSPEIIGDAVTFRIRAPQVTSVKIRGQFGYDVQLSKDQSGVWSATVPHVDPGIYEYRFQVDGLDMIDPLNPVIKPQRSPNTSILQIPANPPAQWDMRDIPHGVLHQHVYFSKALNRWRNAVVYTPPHGDGQLPVLYLSHGSGDNEQTWSVLGKAHLILDSLIASGEAKSMIIVMMDGHALPPPLGSYEGYGVANTEALGRELAEDLIPLVEGAYPARSDPLARAFAGLSMGGHHACIFALSPRPLFRWIGAFSSAPPSNQELESIEPHVADAAKNLALLWMACGKQDPLLQRNQEFDSWLQSRGLPHSFVITDGGHSWPVWRLHLLEFVPKLFR